ncbi:hypothetical protein FJV41_04785 [Myxococcus llanfairpwllgwyngyllgogerychwyrndrobwllllantysiliogogogochensis]|uniref:PKD/Chitinase domain-containing protein n=1 Tax=Myxococcus llanfairpwllgwyngyllgogerychwyrndrobwllllantysiliogogogochensis TaxID=2590453 RepID=A0A540X7F2_9BACT|nr:hypothetical protein [Myxococcus llanfairpwllgwyngyllgogerychwyrndrobwllllantysiliogogogochensis]TQF17112.1 hypothetical protein FJV41_04785 [Myxococcus llanfairpwllgwyngyllgogerychwyrndrobwllllantysiliogogogochensis]
MRIFRRALPGLPMFAVVSLLLQVWGASEAVAAERRFLVDFGDGPTATPGWNNLHFGSTGSSLSNLVDATGVSSGLSLQITDGFWQGWTGAYNGGGTTASTVYPASATRDTFFIGTNEGTTDSQAQVRLSGLAINGTYSLRFYASRMAGDTADRTTRYTVGTQAVDLQATNNIDGVVQLTNLVPSNGALDITVTMKPGAIFGYLGVLEVIEQDGGVVVNQPPVVNAGADRTVPLPTNTVALQQSFSDPEGQSMTFVWSQVSGPTTARLYQNPWTPLVASNLTQGTYVFRLTVTDAQGASASDDVSVSVVPSTGSGTPFLRTLTEKSVTAGGKLIHYYESLPRGYNTDPNRKWPVIVFHHGVGEKGSTPESLPSVLGNMTLVRDNLPLEFAINGVNESFIVMIPQLHGNYGDWQDFFTQAMIDSAKANLRADADRVYLMGFSLGAFHTWSFPQRSDAHARQIAAIVPFSGGRVYSVNGVSQVCRLATEDVPVWAFHAADDGTVHVSSTDAAVNGLNACSPAPDPAPRYTRPATGDHWIIGSGASPTQPVASNIYHWMLSHRRASTPPPPVTQRTLTPRVTTVPKLWNGQMGYYESLPRGYDADPLRRWPLLIFLHGIGERGNGTTELSRTLANGVPAQINAGHPLEFTVNGVTESFVVLVPQLSESGSSWHPYQIERLLDVAQAGLRINPKRVYLTGLSLGGFGTTAFVEFSLANSQRIAAIAPTDGAHYGGIIWTPDLDNVTTDACHLAQADVKVWQFYGANDSSWGRTATDFVARLNACSPPSPTVVTRYENVGHAAYTRAYYTDHTYHSPNLYEWLLAQQRP